MSEEPINTAEDFLIRKSGRTPISEKNWAEAWRKWRRIVGNTPWSDCPVRIVCKSIVLKNHWLADILKDDCSWENIKITKAMVSGDRFLVYDARGTCWCCDSESAEIDVPKGVDLG